MRGSSAGSFPDALQQRAQGSGLGRLPKLPRLPRSKHVRLHCIVSAKPPERHTWQPSFGLGGSSADSASASPGETSSAEPAGGEHEIISWQYCSDCETSSAGPAGGEYEMASWQYCDGYEMTPWQYCGVSGPGL